MRGIAHVQVCLRHLRIGWHLYLLSHTAVPVTQALVTPATDAMESKAQCPARSQKHSFHLLAQGLTELAMLPGTSRAHQPPRQARLPSIPRLLYLS